MLAAVVLFATLGSVMANPGETHARHDRGGSAAEARAQGEARGNATFTAPTSGSQGESMRGRSNFGPALSQYIRQRIENSFSSIRDNFARPPFDQERVELCHVPPGNPDEAHTITVSAEAAEGHLAHGDTRGECPDDGDPQDETAPELSNIAATNISTSSATINWNTDENADGTVYVSDTSPVDTDTALTFSGDSTTTAHAVDLAGLSADTTYYYVVESTDSAGNTATSEEQSFDTTMAPDETAPTISGLSATEIGTSSADISWSTDEDAQGTLYVSDTTPIDPSTATTFDEGSASTSHALTADGLSASTTYYYMVTAEDDAGNTATSSEASFATNELSDETAPTISDLSADDVGTSSASVSWNTDEESDSALYYSTSTPVLPSLATLVSDAGQTLNHVIDLTELAASSTYHFFVTSTDDSGNTATSSESSFTTSELPDETAPTISALSADDIGTSSATINWNTDENADGTIYYSTSTPVDTNTADTMTGATGTMSHAIELSGLSASTTYHYVVTSSDDAGNTATSSEQSFTTNELPDETAPTITNLDATTTSSTTAEVSWQTDEIADSALYYSSTTPVSLDLATQVSDPTEVFNHLLELTDLTASSTYHFFVTSTDESGNTATSSEDSFTTPSE